jgi:hypothetical protein
LTDEEKKTCQEWAKGDHTDWSQFNMVSSIAKMGEILCNNQKDTNDWKARMIKAGFGDSIDIPEDWDTLNEDEKEKRLNNVISCMQEAPKCQK